MFRLVSTAIALVLMSACAMDDEVPPPGPSSGRVPPTTQPRPGPVDAGDTDPPFPGGDGGGEVIDAADLTCGEFGDVCCTEGRPCANDFTHCDPDFGLCAACGDTAGPCCSDGPACQPGLSCTAGVCGP